MRYDITAEPLDLAALEEDALRSVETVVKGTVDHIAEGARRRVLLGPGVIAAGGPSGGPEGFASDGPGADLGFASEGPGVRTGELMSSIVASAERTGTRYFGMVEVRADYGRFVEYGTRYAAPRPFLIPAVEEQRPKVEPELLGGILGAIDRWINGVGAYSGAFPGSDVRTEAEARFWRWRFE